MGRLLLPFSAGHQAHLPDPHARTLRAARILPVHAGMSTRIWRHVERGRCGFCGQRHALEVEYRCVGCDREVCALCLVTVRETHEGFCPECDPAGAREDD